MSTENAPIEEDLPEQLRIRREKRASLLEGGTQPYPVSVPRTKTLKEVREKYSALEIDVATGDIESLTGRIIFKRDTGKLCFATLREGDGTELQAMFSLDKIGQESIDSLGVVCEAKHTGPDGVNKLWEDVELVIRTTLVKTCE